MTVTTPRRPGLLERYDRRWRRREEQIGCGMPFGIPEMPVLWYEVREAVQLQRCGYVSNRALSCILQLVSLPLQPLQLLSHVIGPEVEVRAVPCRNAGA